MSPGDSTLGITAAGLAGKVVVVVGAGRRSSIGASLVAAFASQGCILVLADLGAPANAGHVETRRSAGPGDDDSYEEDRQLLQFAQRFDSRATAMPVDVTSERDVDDLVARVQREFGRLDVVINNAAAPRAGDRVPVVDLPAHEWDRVLEVNLRGTFLVCRAASRVMLGQGHGAIINIASIDGKLGAADAAAYGASKAAAISLTSSLSRELGPHGVTVNAICPGFIDSHRMSPMPASDRDEYVRAHIPMGRAGVPEDVAGVAVFLASSAGAWVTGQSWNVDGGQLTAR